MGMGPKQIIVLWLITGTITLGAVVVAASTGNKALSGLATTIFALTSIVSGWLLNNKITAIYRSNLEIIAARENAMMMAGVFCWAAATILSGYYFTDLFWHHAWQYGGAMMIAAAGLLIYVHFLSNTTSRLRSRSMLQMASTLAIIQACAAAIGLTFLLWSGKLSTNKPDWLANHVFLAGGLTIVALSILSARAQWPRSHTKLQKS